jgi:hypothetical protein
MALVVDNEPLSVTCNSYVSLADMLSYVTQRCSDASIAPAWRQLSEEQKTTYLVNATRSLDMICDWIGNKYSREQQLDWPRYDAWIDGYLQDADRFPKQLLPATCEMAIWAMQNNGAVSVQQDAAYDLIKVGPLTIDYNQDVQGPLNKYFPDILAYLIRDIGSVNNPEIPGANMAKNVRLVRA